MKNLNVTEDLSEQYDSKEVVEEKKEFATITAKEISQNLPMTVRALSKDKNGELHIKENIKFDSCDVIKTGDKEVFVKLKGTNEYSEKINVTAEDMIFARI